MNHYDDLQRFKEKTRTHSLKFKDLSSEATAGERGDRSPYLCRSGFLPICFIRWSALSFKPPLRHLRRRQR